jgi:hypothetical protein
MERNEILLIPFSITPRKEKYKNEKKKRPPSHRLDATLRSSYSPKMGSRKTIPEQRTAARA